MAKEYAVTLSVTTLIEATSEERANERAETLKEIIASALQKAPKWHVQEEPSVEVEQVEEE